MTHEMFSRHALTSCLLALTLVGILFRASYKPANLSSHIIYTAHDARIAMEELLYDLNDLSSQFLGSANSPHSPVPNQSFEVNSAKILKELETIKNLASQNPRQRFYLAHLGLILDDELPSLRSTTGQLQPPDIISEPHPKSPLQNSLHLATMILEEQDRIISVDHDQLIRSIHTQSVLWHVLTGLCLLTTGILGFRFFYVCRQVP